MAKFDFFEHNKKANEYHASNGSVNNNVTTGMKVTRILVYIVAATIIASFFSSYPNIPFWGQKTIQFALSITVITLSFKLWKKY